MQFLEDSAMTNLKHMTRIAYNSVFTVSADATLAPGHRELLNTACMCLLQTNRIVNLGEFLAHADEAALQKQFQNFEIKNLVEEITNTFYKTLIGYVPIDIKISIDLEDTTYIMLDKARFELTFLNLLYCSLKSHDTLKPAPVKLNISVTETRNCVVFHIKDNSKLPKLTKQPSAFCLSRPNQSIFNGWSLSSLLSMSLQAAQIFSEQMDGNVVHTTLKTGNRYDIYLPKHREGMVRMQSISKYTPTECYFKEIFSDFMLQTNLEKVVNAFDGFDGIK